MFTLGKKLTKYMRTMRKTQITFNLTEENHSNFLAHTLLNFSYAHEYKTCKYSKKRYMYHF